MGKNTLIYVLVAVLAIGLVVWMITKCNSRNGFTTADGVQLGRSNQEDTFLPVIMANLGANSTQFNTAVSGIRQYDAVCGKASAAAEIQGLLNTYAPSSEWTEMLSQLSEDIQSVQNNPATCVNTKCQSSSDCAYSHLDPTLIPHQPGLMPGYDCESGACKIYRS